MSQDPGVAAVVARGAGTIRKLANDNRYLIAENQQLRDKVASYERRDVVRHLAQRMEAKGLETGKTFDEKVASISATSDLEKVAAAIDMAGVGSIDLAQVAEDRDSRGPTGTNQFNSFCVTGQQG